MLPLALAGGGALLLGLVFLAWHALEQGWIQETERLVLGAVAAVALTVAAWPLARRGHTSVAGAVGGAGLGAWFSAWVVARHVHDLVSAPQAFAALAIAAAACLLLADRLRLRLMAGLATVAACTTPALTATGADRLPELMVYQLVFLAALAVLDARRGWPELPTIGLLGTWALLMGWGAQHLSAANNTAFVTCAVVLIVATAALGWRLLRQGATRADQINVAIRIGLTGTTAWSAVGWAFYEDFAALAFATFALAGWHLGLAAFALRRSTKPEHDDQRIAAHAGRVSLRLGWAQLAAVAPLAFSGVAVGVYLVVMAAAAAAMTYVGTGKTGPRLLLLPTLAAVGWAIGHDDATWALPLAAVASAVPLAVGLWPGRQRAPRLLWVALGTVAWIASVVVLGPEAYDAKLAIGVLPAAIVAARNIAAPASATGLTAVQLVVAAAAAAAVVFGTKVAAPGMLIALLFGLAALGVGVIAREVRSDHVDLIGATVAVLIGSALYLTVPMAVPALTAPGHTVVVAACGLGLLIGGLRLDRDVWRHLGLSAIALAGAKVVIFDLANAPLVARAFSFIGIGAVLIIGAIAYGNAHRRLRRAANLARHPSRR